MNAPNGSSAWWPIHAPAALERTGKRGHITCSAVLISPMMVGPDLHCSPVALQRVGQQDISEVILALTPERGR